MKKMISAVLTIMILSAVSASAATAFSDDFERSTTGPQYTNTIPNAIGPYTVVSGAWNISNASSANRIPNFVTAASTFPNSIMIANSQETLRNGTNSFSLSADVWNGGYEGSSTCRQGLVFNFQDEDNFYAFDYSVTSAGNGTVHLLKYVDGVRTVLAQLGGLNLYVYTYYTMTIDADATNMIARLKTTDGTSIFATIQSSTVFTNGYAGFWRNSAASVAFDNFSLESPGQGTTLPPATMGFAKANGMMTITAGNLSASSEITNILQSTTNLTSGAWSNLYTVTGITDTNWSLPFDSSQRFYRIQTVRSWSQTIDRRVLLAGDSTVYNFDPIVGWGQRIGQHFKPGIETINKAYPGRSSKTFIEEGRWDDLLSETQPGDYILVQFAHNDSHDPSNPESTDAETDYRDYLRIYADDAASAGANLVFVTSPHRRLFNEDGTITQELLPYADAMKAVAQEKNVPVVDLYSLSGADMQELGEEGCLPLFTSADDRTHFSDEGANWLAGLVAGELQKITDLVAEN